MTIDCRLKVLCREKGKGKEKRLQFEIKSYEAHIYDKKDFDLTYILQIASVPESEDESRTIFAEKEIILTGTTCHHISFYKVTYIYDERINRIYCNSTKMTI